MQTSPFNLTQKMGNEMRSGAPRFAHYGQASCEQKIRVKLGEKFVDVSELEIPESIWSKTEIDLSGRDSISGLEINLESKIEVKDDCKGYDWTKFADYFDFVVVLTNTSSRKRSCFDGLIVPNFYKGQRKAVRYSGKLENKVINLEDFSGEITLEPLFVVKNTVPTGQLLDSISMMQLVPGTVVAFSEPIRVILNREKRGLMSLFEFVWLPFSKNSNRGLPEKGIFSLEWNESPKIYINQDIDDLENILTSEAKVGNTAVARDSVNLTIAHQVLTSVFGLIIKKIVQLHSDFPEDSAEEIAASLDLQERQFLSSWSYVLDPSHDPAGNLDMAIDNLIGLDDAALNEFLTREIPVVLQQELASQVAVEKMFKALSKRIGGDDNEQQ